jgi:hypothetical protein
VLVESHGAALTQPGPSASTAVTLSTTGEPGGVPTETGSGMSAGCFVPRSRVSISRFDSVSPMPAAAPNRPVMSTTRFVATLSKMHTSPVAPTGTIAAWATTRSRV